MTVIAYVNNTGTDIRDFHSVIVDSIKNGGVLPDELSDVFTLTLADNGNWVLNWV